MKTICTLILFTGFFAAAYAQQRTCGTHEMHLKTLAENPERAAYFESMQSRLKQWTDARKNELQERSGGGFVLTIPCVVHVLYNTAEQNISDEQVHSQIDVLNQDFRLLNADSPDSSHTFFPEAADALFEFCLATQDPDGFETNGINRVQTPKAAWNSDNIDSLKRTDLGGVDNWDPEKYLNIWVFHPDSTFGLLGFATFPDGMLFTPMDDGVAIRNDAFGTTGIAEAPFDRGRTATHEIGHWLFLRHIWGDAICGDDFVDDTPVHQNHNFGCPQEPLNPDTAFCLVDSRGEMFMNYMDYTHDTCMYMFSFGQTIRMWGAVSQFRNQIFESPGCLPGTPVSVKNIQSKIFKSFPNPFIDNIRLQLVKSGNYVVRILDMNQRLIFSTSIYGITTADLNLAHVSQGIYILQVMDMDNMQMQRQKIIRQ